MATNNNNRIPELRFPGFEGEWVIKQIEEIFKITRGQVLPMKSVSPTKDENNPYAVYSSQTLNNGLAGFYKDFLYENAITWTTDGANAGEVRFRAGKFYCTNVCGVLLSNEGYANECIAAILNSVTKSHVSYVGNPKLMNNVMAKISILLPPTLAEQQKIADCLSSLDEEIAAEAQKADALKDHKKGLTQQLFPAISNEQLAMSNCVPKLRFSEFTGSWEVKKLGEVFTRITRKNNEDNRNVLTISAQYGLVSQTDFFNKSVAAADVTGYYLLERGNFAYNKSSSSGNPMGVIKPLKKYEKGVVSTLYICFSCNEPKSISFWEQYFNAGCLDSEIRTIAQEGARNHGLLNVPTSDFFTLKVLVPTLAEQQKIADCLSELDEMISAQQQKVEALKEHKKGLMQKLFPKMSNTK